MAREGTFVDGNTGGHLTFVNWARGEPNNVNNEDCVVLKAGSWDRWNDVGCHNWFEALCESV